MSIELRIHVRDDEGSRVGSNGRFRDLDFPRDLEQRLNSFGVRLSELGYRTGPHVQYPAAQ